MLGFGALGQVPLGSVPTGATETIREDKWHQAWSEPVRRKPPLPIGAYQFLAYSESAQFPETVTESRWHQPWSEPSVKAKIGLRSAAQQFIAFQPSPSPFVATGWFDWLSDPVRQKPGLSAQQQQALAFQPMPSPFVASGWFEWFAEPVRFKPGIGTPLQQFFTTDTSVIPLTRLVEWFAPFREPVRVKPGLNPSLQDFLAWPPRLLPTPTITGILNATETKDVLFAGGAAFNAPISADVGVIELAARQIAGIIEAASRAPLAGVIEQGVSPTPGSAVAIVVTAAVSIRQI